MAQGTERRAFRAEKRRTYDLFHVEGRFSARVVDDLREATDKALSSGQTRIGFDLSKVVSLDSSSLGLLLGLHKRLTAKGGEVILLGISAQIRPAINAANLLNHITYFASPEDAEVESAQPELDIEERATYLLIGAPPEFRAGTIHPIREAVRTALDKGHSNIVFDLASTSFMDSVALGLLMNVHKRLMEREGGVGIVGGMPEIKRLLEATNISRVIPQYGSVEEADEKIL